MIESKQLRMCCKNMGQLRIYPFIAVFDGAFWETRVENQWPKCSTGTGAGFEPERLPDLSNMTQLKFYMFTICHCPAQTDIRISPCLPSSGHYRLMQGHHSETHQLDWRKEQMNSESKKTAESKPTRTLCLTNRPDWLSCSTRPHSPHLRTQPTAEVNKCVTR